MIYSSYYSDVYKPYILKGDDSTVVRSKRFKNVNNMGNKGHESSTLTMNKAYKSNVISYINDFSEGMNNIKTSVGKIIKQGDKLEVIAKFTNEEHVSEKVADALDEFATGLDDIIGNKDFRNKSVQLDDYISMLENEMEDGKFKNIGIVKRDGRVYFNREDFKDNSFSKQLELISSIQEPVAEILESTKTIMELPLSEHMNFKSFSYYFNYSMGDVKAESFKLVEQGMIVDIAI